jgi:hypothetical protein
MFDIQAEYRKRFDSPEIQTLTYFKDLRPEILGIKN